MSPKDKKLSTDPYVGVRDFYPEDMAIQRHIFETWAKTAESFGFERYDASVLEPSELYRSKTSDEIVNEQTYTFTDRGDREVTLRPEMTPTVARMVAGRRRELSFPLRWYAIPNLFRYERKQRGRVREHWQLNCDIFGSEKEAADIEIILLASSIMRAFGATEDDFTIRINSRKLWNSLTTHWGIGEEKRKALSALVDRINKVSKEEFETTARELISDEATTAQFLNLMWGDRDTYSADILRNSEYEELSVILGRLSELGVANAVYDPTIMRGFDYYTGTIFELFDTNAENRRSLLGGGRYDNLTGIFGGDPIPAVGFGMGDVTMRDFLETHNLIPKDLHHIDLAIIPHDMLLLGAAEKSAQVLRTHGLSVYVSLADKKLGDHIKIAEARGATHIMVIGEHEVQGETYTIKRLSDSTTQTGSLEEIAALLKS